MKATLHGVHACPLIAGEKGYVGRLWHRCALFEYLNSLPWKG